MTQQLPEDVKSLLLLAETLQEAYHLIDDLVCNLPQCNCAKSYRAINRVDPGCIHHIAVEEDTYNDLVAWRNRFATPKYRWMIE